MKSYKVWQEGWFSKKEPEDKDEKELQDLGMKDMNLNLVMTISKMNMNNEMIQNIHIVQIGQ